MLKSHKPTFPFSHGIVGLEGHPKASAHIFGEQFDVVCPVTSLHLLIFPSINLDVSKISLKHLSLHVWIPP